MYPRVTVHLPRLRENVALLRDLCARHGVEIMGVTKVFGGEPAIAQAYLGGGLTRLADSRVANLARLAELPAEKWLIRPPMACEVPDLVRYGDGSLNSEPDTLDALAKEARRQGKPHQVILMADLGDLREGYVDYDALLREAERCARLEGLHLAGLGTNLTCFSFVQPDEEKMETLSALTRRAREATGLPLELVSGGNSATLDLMLRGGLDGRVNSLRLGESLLFGRERAQYQYLPGTHQDVFTLECQIVECKEKPSLPWGQIGRDSYGNRPAFTDSGPRLQAICALGRQDFDLETTWPADPGVRLLGASSDHLMADVTQGERQYRVGDVLTLRLGYFSTMRAFTSRYVEKVYCQAAPAGQPL